jgi:stress response protein YsnF
MLSERELSAAIGSTAYDGNGDKIGTVEHFFVDDRTGAPTWVALSTGLFGTRHSIAPAVDATFADGNLRLPVTVDAVKNAPHMSGDHLDPQEESELRRHYGISSAGAAPAAAPTQEMPAVPPPVPATGTDTSARDTDTGAADVDATSSAAATSSDGAMTRSEERLQVGTERVATTRTRLVKYVVTEEVQITVPIRREEIRIEEVPLDAVDEGPGESLVAADDSPRRGTVQGLPDEIVLHTERPVVTVEVVPTERVRLRTELVQGQETVTGQVQREQIVVDQDMASGSDATTRRLSTGDAGPA